MIPVSEALARILSAFAPLPAETIPITAAVGRVLAADVAARLTHPPQPVSAMDGWAVRTADIASLPATLRRVGEAPAGRPFAGTVGPGEAVRIFTGGFIPAGADTVVIQEDCAEVDGTVTVREGTGPGRWVRRAGLDFARGDTMLHAGRQLTVRDVALCAAMNVPWVAVRRKPRVAILATGDEIVLPGETPNPGQIVGSNGIALAAMVARAGGEAVDLGVAGDTRDSVAGLAAGAAGCDLLVTIGGASVGEHDLVRDGLGAGGLSLDFWKIAMRPGKPLMFGRHGATPMIGLPGNPVSALVCALLFIRPALRAMQGLPPDDLARRARLGGALPANDRRQDYLRATMVQGDDGLPMATAFAAQDSSMLSRLAEAGCLIVRPPLAAPAAAGDIVDIIPLDTI